MVKTKINCQNLAYCRYLQLWGFSSIINIVDVTPLISLLLVSFLHLSTLKCNNKRVGILLTDYTFISIIYNKDKNLYIIPNIIVFLFYIKMLYIIKVSPIKLYTKYLVKDDKKYDNESYFNYIKRIWKLFLHIH